MHHVDAGHQLQIFEREVPGAAVARGAIGQGARLRLGERDELLQVLRRHVRRVDHEDVRHLREQRDRHEILVDVVRQLREHVRIHRERADVADDDRVAVRLGARDLLHRDVACSARLVVDDHLLAERLRHLRRHRARDDLGAAARRERHDEPHRLRRPGLREGAARAGGEGDAGQQRGETRNGFHWTSCNWVVLSGILEHRSAATEFRYTSRGWLAPHRRHFRSRGPSGAPHVQQRRSQAAERPQNNRKQIIRAILTPFARRER